MLKRLALASALSALFASGTLAQTPNNPDECLDSAFELAQAAEEKNLPDEQFDKVEDLLIEMERHCDANRYSEAMAVAQNLKVMIEKQ
jgi:hypothetical protein